MKSGTRANVKSGAALGLGITLASVTALLLLGSGNAYQAQGTSEQLGALAVSAAAFAAPMVANPIFNEASLSVAGRGMQGRAQADAVPHASLSSHLPEALILKNHAPAATLLAASLGVQKKAQQPLSKAALKLVQGFEKKFKEALASENIPGAAFTIVYDGEIVASGAAGVRRLGGREPVDTKTIFPLASVSKTFAGTAAGLLAEEGKLDLEAPLSRYLPDFRLASKKDSEALRLRHLLSHSVGLVPNAYDNLVDAGQSLDQILPRFRDLKSVCHPGDCYGYQNIAFSLIEPALADAAGEPYADFLKDRFFAPLGMAEASVGFAALKANSNHASPHVKRRKAWQARDPSPNYYRLAPAAGVNASIEDLGKWLIAQMGGKPEILAPRVVERITKPQTSSRRELYRRFWRDYLSDAHYGLGWRLYDFEAEKLVYHGGGIKGFRSSIAYSPKHNLGLALLVNADSRVIDSLNTKFWDAFFNDPTLAEGNKAPEKSVDAYGRAE